ncbi:TonB-dependent receptor [Reichenbachiella ulvae]|uniref:TonB-dependent receptor n=1 Tax=Reichenbachiella ulvae TaxID=2980104 RepID=A0ABT3CQE5_9BACT|nr:TonB-dependent receptor [Reichenbachiella ulvae]MCV9385874.1 TonB-dependent receptor [Reichenbachiella ulvae]
MKWILIVNLVLLSIFSHAQSRLEGRVIDEETKEGIPGVIVEIHELERGVLTNPDGYFYWDGIRKANYHLHFSYLGYQAVTRVIGADEFDELIEVRLKPTSLELNEVLIESNHYKTGPKEQTLSMEILDTDFLLKNRKGSFVGSLENLPGVNTINTGVGISKPVIRGMSFNRVIVNDKGIKQEGQQWGSDHGLEIDMFEPGRVEVVKGPSSLQYGSDGLGGVINIFPPAVPNSDGHKGTLQLLYKSNNHLLGTSTSIEGKMNAFVYRARFSTQDFGDYRVPADEFNYNGTINPIFDEHLKNTAGRERNFSLMAGVKKDWGHSTLTISNFQQRVGLFPGVVGIQGLYQLDPDGNRRNIDQPRQETDHFKVISNTNLLLGRNWLELDLGYQRNLRKEISQPHNGQLVTGDPNLALHLDLQTVTLNARYYLHQHADHSRTVGIQGQYQVNQVKGFEHLIPDYKSSAIGAYLYEEHSWWEHMTLTGGLRIDYANRNISSFRQPIVDADQNVIRYYERNPEVDRNFGNYSAAIGLSYYPSSSFNAKLNIGSSYKVPSANELSINGIHHGTFRHELGDADLESERGWQGDLSLSYQKSNLSLVVTPFASYFTNFIYLSPSPQFSTSLDEDAFFESTQVFQYKQHDAFFAGSEVTLEFHPIDQLHWQTAFEYIYNYNLETYLPLPLTPPASLFSELDYEWEFGSKGMKDLEIGLNAKWVWDQNRVDRNERVTEGYFVLGATLGTGFRLGNQEVNLFLSASNLLDQTYMNHLSRYRLLNLPEQGRNFSVSLHIPLFNHSKST